MVVTSVPSSDFHFYVFLSFKMGNLWSILRFSSKSAASSKNEMTYKTSSKEERIRASRGYHEAEISCTGEFGLQQCLIMCKKNPGHRNFIPTNEFSIEHLPSHYRDDAIVEWVKATSDVTCRLSVTGISENRPDTWPESDTPFPFSAHMGQTPMMVGTGWVSEVIKYTNGNFIDLPCECEECHRPGSHPQKKWGKIWIRTASHVVFDDEEAKHTKCQFFYDSPETDINQVLTLTGLKVVGSDIKGDWCTMVYITHDIELLDRFEQMYWRWRDLRTKVCLKYKSRNSTSMCVPGEGCDTNFKHDLCIVVSHPHGRPKQVTVGTWTHRHVIDKDEHLASEDIKYSYNTPTCPGSSGAPVITLWKKLMWPGVFYNLPPHSQGQPDNDNNSGVGLEWIKKKSNGSL